MQGGCCEKQLMRKVLLLLCISYASFAAQAQDTTAVKDAVDRLQRSLVGNDTMALKQLLHKDLRFGHSNGWVQTKRAAIEDMKNGSLVYDAINRQTLEIEMLDKAAYVKERLEVRGRRNGTEFNLRIFVLQRWVKTKKGWQLLMRQSAKLA
jgi:hypothetical protein